MSEGIRAPNIDPGSNLTEFMGFELVGTKKSLRRFSRASVIGSIEAVANSFTVGGGVIFTTLSQALANLNYNANQMAWVINDTTSANNGVYQKTGASGSGSWARLGNLPYSFYRAVNVGAGTANAIKATNTNPLASKDSLIVVNITDANTDDYVTIQFNDDQPLVVKTVSGGDVAVGGLSAGMIVGGFIDPASGTFRLITDQTSAAIQAAAEAAALTATTARDVAVSAAGTNLINYVSRTALAGATVPVILQYAVVAGYAAEDDAPIAKYVRVATPDDVKPWHVQSADGGYWELRTQESVPELFGAKGDNVNNDVDAVQAALDYAIALNVPLVLTKTYYCSGDVYGYNPGGSIVIRGNGHFTGLNFAGSTSLRVTGSATALPGLSSGVTANDTQINFTSSVADSLSPNDKFFIWNTTPASWLANRDAYCRGEIVQVSKVDANTAYIYGAAMDNYGTGSNIQPYKLNPVQAVLSDFGVTTTGTPGTLCQIDLSSGSRVSGLRVDGNPNTGLSLRRSYDAQFTGIVTNCAGYPTTRAYGFSIANSQNVKVFGTGSASTRQSLLIGGYGSADATDEAPSLNIVNRFVSVSGMHLQNTNNDAGDMHGNCEFCEYVNCTMWGGAAIGGQNNRWVDCVIYPIRDTGITSGYCVHGSEIRGGTFEFINCKFPFGNGDMAAQGVVNILNNYMDCQVLDLYVDVINCEFVGAGATNGTPVQVTSYTNTAPKVISVRVIDCIFKINNMNAVLYVNAIDITTTFYSNYLIVDNPTYTGSGNPYFIYPGASIVNAPKRESRQCGVVDVTTTASTVAAAGNQTFKFKYSKIPTVTASVSKPDGSMASTYGGAYVAPIIYGLSTSTIRPAITSATTMSSGDTARLHWSAEVRDV